MSSAAPEGVRIATVGIGTFTVSLLTVFWALAAVVGRTTRQPALYVAGAVPLVVALIVLLATPRVALGADGAPAAANSAAAYSNFFLSLGGVAFVVVAGAVGALGCVGAVELFASRRARVIP